MKNILVADVMTRGPYKIKPDTTLLECSKIMVKKKVGSLLIVDEKRLVGFIAKKDILWALTKTKSREEFSQIKAIDVSPRKLATIRPTASVDEAIKKMKTVKFERLPVIQKGELVGMVTFKDILSFHPEVYPEMEEFTQIRDESEKLKRITKARQRKMVYDGICEECGNTNLLFRFNGMMMCDSCMASR